MNQHSPPKTWLLPTFITMVAARFIFLVYLPVFIYPRSV
jgi:hypothetical protein